MSRARALASGDNNNQPTPAVERSNSSSSYPQQSRSTRATTEGSIENQKQHGWLVAIAEHRRFATIRSLATRSCWVYFDSPSFVRTRNVGRPQTRPLYSANTSYGRCFC